MATLTERVLARVDRVVHELFRMERSENPFGVGTYKDYYWNHWGRRCAIVDRDGSVSYIGHSFNIRHEYDANGVLLSRLAMRKLAGPGERVLYGREADLAWQRDALGSRQGFGLEN